MIIRHFFTAVSFCCGIVGLIACGDRPTNDVTHFTKADSVTETYLNLKDLMLESWNVMINDDNQKIKALQNLLHELKVSNPGQRDEYKIFEERIDRLAASRYTQKSMVNMHVIEEYDFASQTLITELVSLAESQTQFSYNTTMQKLVEAIRSAEQRVENYRSEYDRVASEYNDFLEKNKVWLKDISTDSFSGKKPLFKVVSEEVSIEDRYN